MNEPHASSDAPGISPAMVIYAYSRGAFPMAESREDDQVGWYRPEARAVMPLQTFHCPKNLKQRVRNRHFSVRSDTAFQQVMLGCAQPRRDHEDTWINPAILTTYCQLHAMGIAHSVEAWCDDELVGGLYGLAIGGVFFGESMFHRPNVGGRDASKVCLVHLVGHLRVREFGLLDVQMPSTHLEQFGIDLWPNAHYLKVLHCQLARQVSWDAATVGQVPDWLG